ncbi:MAG: glycosyltransferase family 39 protein [Phycisphaerae bacterium]
MDTPSSAQPPHPDEPRATDATGLRPNRTRFSFARVLVFLIGVAVVTLAITGAWSTYWAEQRNDQYELLHLGQCVYNGQRMYVDCWENKPPGIAWINALGIALSGGRQIGAWVTPGVTLLLCLAISAYAMKRVLSATAAWGTLLIGAAITTLRLYDTPSINPDFYSSMFELAACSVWLLSLCAERMRRRIWLGLAAGLLWAAATAVKQTGVVGLLAVSTVAIVLTALKQPERRRWLGAGGLAWIGFALGAAAVTGVLHYRETLGPAWAAIFEFNRGLLTSDSITSALTSWSRIRAGLGPVQLPLWLALIGVVTTVLTVRVNRLSRGLACAMLLWWIAQVVLALLGPSRSMRYWQATWPAMLWLAAIGIYHLEETFRRLDRAHRGAVAIACATVVVLLGRPLVDHYEHGLATSYLAHLREYTDRDRLENVGREIQALVPEDQPVYVWAYDAGIYVYASRRAASRFTYPRSEDQMREILADLEAGKAYAIMVPEEGSAVFDRWCDKNCHDHLAEILSRYEVTTTIGPYPAWIQPAEVDAGPRETDPP